MTAFLYQSASDLSGKALPSRSIHCNGNTQNCKFLGCGCPAKSAMPRFFDAKIMYAWIVQQYFGLNGHTEQSFLLAVPRSLRLPLLASCAISSCRSRCREGSCALRCPDPEHPA